jgi:hypothetical protein
VTIGRTPTAAQETAFAVEGLFLPYLRDPQSGEITHWVAHAHTALRDRPRGLSFPAEVTLVLDCRVGLPGRLIPILHHWRNSPGPVELLHTVYVGHWEGQERVFRDMCACQNLDAHYGQKKVAVPNRRQERQRQTGQRQQQAVAKRLATARRKVEDYTRRRTDLKEETRQQRTATQKEVQALRQASREAPTAKQREKLLVQAERRAAQGRMQQLRQQQKQRRWKAQQQAWERKLASPPAPAELVLPLPQTEEDPPFYDFDLEKDDLMTYLRMAGENAHRFVQEQYFAGTFLEKVDEETMVRVIYHQPGWIQQRPSSLQIQLQGYRDPKMQAAVVQACHRVNQAQVQLPSGHRLHMEVRTKILEL